MKKIISLVCAVVLLALCIAPMPAKAATTTDTLEMSAVFLRTAEGKEGIFFGAKFNLSEDTLADMTCYGLALTTKNLDSDDTWTDEMDTSVLRSRYNSSSLIAGTTKEVTSTSLVNIINTSNDSMTNNRNVNTVIYVRPYVETNGTYQFGAVKSITMMQILKAVDNHYNDARYVDNTQKQGLLGMYERFSSCMKGWGLTNLKAHYTSGGYVTVKDENDQEKQVSLILQYRREKVFANMQAQAEILWSFDGTDSIKYSRTVNSKGYDSDTQSNVYTLYPDRIYKGIPYTHGAAGLDAYYTYGTQNSDGVWELKGVNSSTFSGESWASDFANNGANNGRYNVARMGNNCWDALSWAYESIGSSVSAEQTDQLTSDFGMYPIGEYDINHFQNRAQSDGKLRLKAYFEESYTSYYENNPENKQLMYEAYALLQKGDTLVHFNNGNGHALMVYSVYIVRNSDNTIDPDQSTVTYIEQGSTHEYNQSKFSTTPTSSASHYVHSSLNANCLQCAQKAGYDPETGIWTLNSGKISGTLTELFDEGYYIPMTSEELRNPAAKISASRISDSASDADVSGVYTGALSSTYRVSKVVLDIYDVAGNKINSTTCLSAQSDLNKAFELVRFITDQDGAYGSVLKGKPALQQKNSGTNTWLEAPTLPEGSYSYTMTCVLANGYTNTFRSGYFTVSEGNNPNGTSAHMVYDE